jgi:hypothetical protein
MVPLGQGVKERLSDRIKAIPREIGAELSRLGTQGATESASGLFQGQSNAFVPYGIGQDVQRFKGGRDM